MSIVTKTGDKGITGLYGGARVSKHDPRIEAIGTVDELNATIGAAIASGMPLPLQDPLLRIQHALFRVGGDLATPLTRQEKEERVGPEHVEVLEEWIRTLESSLPPQTKFILPGGSSAGAHLHCARTICRRAERIVVRLMSTEAINPGVQIYLNRLSDYLFLAAREVNRLEGIPDVEVQY